TESFNSMTRQLAEARRVVEANRIALEAAKGHLENILANLSAGVLVFDHELQLTISNRGAAAILGAEAESFASRMQELFREHGRLDLNELVNQVLALYENSTVPIAKRLTDGLPPVWADSAQIRQVIHNLVQNAQDALENVRQSGASPAIEVRTELAGDRVKLAVSDNGAGFPEELMARIFEPYVTTKPRGTGLGLAIVKKIVDEHHGSVAIENRPSRGASVSVLLPLAKAA